jgi:hypothetical protein
VSTNQIRTGIGPTVVLAVPTVVGPLSVTVTVGPMLRVIAGVTKVGVPTGACSHG